MPVSIIQALIALGGATLLIYWILPAILLTGLFVAVAATILPKGSLPGMLLSLNWGQRLLIIAILGTMLGVSLASLQPMLYRLLEGYILPRPIQRWLVERELNLKRKLEVPHSTGMHQVLARERLRRYPAADHQVAPSHLGNAIRAMETYSYELYDFDTTSLYDELSAIAPEGLRGLPERRRLTVDLFINLTALSLTFSVLTVAFEVLYSSPILLILLPAYAVIGVASYRLAVVSCDGWRRAIEAMVNLGRKPLAEAFGYTFPTDPEQERRMWRHITMNLYAHFHPSEGWLNDSVEDQRQLSSQDDQD